MSPTARGPSNALVAALPPRDRAIVLKNCEEVELALSHVICEPGSPITHVYFPVTSYISLITPKDVVDSLEVGLIGREGVFGITVLLDVNDSPLLALVQGEGAALRMTPSAFRKAAATSPSFRRMLNRYLYVLMAQIAQSAACGRFHMLDARLARWLLMTHDRAGSKTFSLTHQFLAFMLGVRRAGVTIAAGRLQELNLIRYNRGRVEILDRKGLEALSCPCYAEQLRIYRARMGIADGRAPPHARSRSQQPAA
jgi:CRP-like cAMP-binding protein